MDNDESYLLLLLSDSNLPTGSFVASGGLESYVTHGFFSNPSSSSNLSPDLKLEHTVNFLRDSLSAYARSALPFVVDAHDIVHRALNTPPGDSADVDTHDAIIRQILEIDKLYEAMTLNHIARRASKSQGVALFTLFAKGFRKPNLPQHLTKDQDMSSLGADGRVAVVVERLKLLVRRGDAHGHLPICWGVLTAALGLSAERSQYLHLFLQARSLLSSSVRLNTIGPYAAQQLLLHVVRPLVNTEMARCQHLRTGLGAALTSDQPSKERDSDGTEGPAITWPLGEILASRHDLQHSRIFNS